MTATPLTSDAARNARFLRTHLARFGGNAKAAAAAARVYADQGEYGRGWWHYVAGQCAYEYAMSFRSAKGDRIPGACDISGNESEAA